jgi:hypothetical protein
MRTPDQAGTISGVAAIFINGMSSFRNVDKRSTYGIPTLAHFSARRAVSTASS